MATATTVAITRSTGMSLLGRRVDVKRVRPARPRASAHMASPAATVALVPYDSWTAADANRSGGQGRHVGHREGTDQRLPNSQELDNEANQSVDTRYTPRTNRSGRPWAASGAAAMRSAESQPSRRAVSGGLGSMWVAGHLETPPPPAASRTWSGSPEDRRSLSNSEKPTSAASCRPSPCRARCVTTCRLLVIRAGRQND